MSPIDYIKEGINEGNWNTVCDGYERLTGETVSPPAEHNAQKAILRIRDIISDTLSETLEPKPAKTSSTKSKKKATRKMSSRASEENDASIILDEDKKTVVQPDSGNTQFITNEPDPAEVELNRIKARKVGKNHATTKRNSTKTYDVVCNECENVFQSNRPTGEMGQKCKKCLESKRSRFDG